MNFLLLCNNQLSDLLGWLGFTRWHGEDAPYGGVLANRALQIALRNLGPHDSITRISNLELLINIRTSTSRTAHD